MTTAELYKKYLDNPPVGRQPLTPEKPSPTVAILAYNHWIQNRCACCRRGGASGIWRCEFTSETKPMLLCAACGLRDAFAKWNGFYSRKLVHIDLIITLTYQSKTPEAMTTVRDSTSSDSISS